MPAFTVRYRPIPSASQRRALEDFAGTVGAKLSWMQNESYGRAYALIEAHDVSDETPARAIAVSDGAAVFETPVIALAIRPSVPEAMPALEQALAGPGRPAGIRGVERHGASLIVEWNLDVTPASTIVALIDVELARVRCGRVTELLSPLPLEWWTRIAADGLQAPEIAPDRVLEALLEDHHVVG